jgi:3-oxoacyl-[acyl-carrier protein] reductase
MAHNRRAVLVTGAGGGLGRAVSLAFANAGYDVVVNYAHSEDDAQATGEAVRECGAQAYVVQADVADDAAVRRMIADTVATFGGLDALVNNAGTTQYVPLADLEAISDQLWDRVLGVNLKGPFYCARAAAPHLRARRGSIVNIASNSAFRPTGSSIPYMTSKAGLVMLTRCLAQALGPDVRTNAVAPGWLETPWVDKYVPAEHRGLLFAEGAAPPADLGDVARAVLFLAETPSVNGQTLIVDRGQVLR